MPLFVLMVLSAGLLLLAPVAHAIVVWAPLGQDQYFLIYEAQDYVILIGGAVFTAFIAIKLWDWLRRVTGR